MNRDRSLDNDLAWERVLQKGHAPRSEPQSDDDWARLRRANPFNGLLPASREWIGTLPGPLKPNALATQYPRIVNLVAQHWSDPAACGAYLDELVNGGRPNRRGFPGDVHRDILGLREYFLRWHLRGDTALTE
jgi:hypothetical protein